jgi:hypothetical protein
MSLSLAVAVKPDRFVIPFYLLGAAVLASRFVPKSYRSTNAG